VSRSHDSALSGETGLGKHAGRDECTEKQQRSAIACIQIKRKLRSPRRGALQLTQVSNPHCNASGQGETNV
jgi:hypothetical protein